MPALYIPTAFTPNNDNLNDVFGVRGQYIDQIEIYVYNRWGNIVFYTQDMTQTWDGNNAPEGAYVFYVVYKDINGFYNVEYGTLTLYR
jgi:gliding motility-associated-like protein